MAIFVGLIAVALVVVDWQNAKENSSSEKQVCALGKPCGYQIAGIDISHHNGNIDWPEIKKQGVHFAYLKTTEGETKLDKDYQEDYALAKEHELLVGSYHFFLFNKDGVKQAKFFLSKLRYEQGDLPPVVDVEYSPWNKRNMSKKVLKSRLRELARFDSVIFRKTNRHVLIYTNKQGYEDMIRGNFPDNELWICDLSSEPDEEKYPNWVIWQYSHKGKIEGLQTNVDLNVFHSDSHCLEKWICNNTKKAPEN